MKLEKIGLFGIISLLSYLAMVIFSPFAYKGYNWMTMAVSELSAVGSPSKALADQLNSLFGPCGLVSIMAVCVAAKNFHAKSLRIGIYLFAGMEWVVNVGYSMFPWVESDEGLAFQSIMHIAVTIITVVLSITSLVFIIIGAKKGQQKSLKMWAIVCLIAMLGGAMGTNLLPKAVFGIAERFSTFSVVVFNAIMGYYLLIGKFTHKEKNEYGNE